MLFELQSDFLPLLFTVSVLFTYIELYVCIHFSNKFLNEHYLDQSNQSYSLSSISVHHVIELSKSKQAWITRIVKRKEAPEDDTDYILNSALSYYLKTEEDINENKICIHSNQKNDAHIISNSFSNFNRLPGCYL